MKGLVEDGIPSPEESARMWDKANGEDSPASPCSPSCPSEPPTPKPSGAWSRTDYVQQYERLVRDRDEARREAERWRDAHAMKRYEEPGFRRLPWENV